MAKYTPTTVSNIGGNPNSAQNTINQNFEDISTAIEVTLSRDGTLPNQMEADLDMNSNDILNVGSIGTLSLTVDGVDVNDIVGQPGPSGPPGEIGPQGSPGPQGDQGDAATITLGTVTTGAAGSSVIITNTGDTSAAVFNFTIPRGDTGASGAGSGDVNGPGSSIVGHLATWGNSDGTLLADGGAVPSGTVTSVGMSVPTGLSVSGSPVTSSGTLTVTWSGTIPVANGSTGLASYAVGDLLYASGSTALSRLAGVATGNALISGGMTTAPAWGKIGLTTHISGTLAIANGGTNITSYATGDILYASGTNTLSKLTAGSDTEVLTLSGGVPIWAAPSSAGSLLNIQVIASTGTYTPTSGTKKVKLILIGGGGGGGAAGSTVGTAGAGGGAGAVTIWYIASPTSGTVIIGAGGTGGIGSGSAGNAGASGTASSFSTVTAPGGSGGSSGGSIGTAGTRRSGGAGGVAGVNGTLMVPGFNGFDSQVGATGNGNVLSGRGADSPYGPGGLPVIASGSPGNNGAGYGSGGSGGTNSGTSSGGNGANGVAIFEEYA